MTLIVIIYSYSMYTVLYIMYVYWIQHKVISLALYNL